MIYVLSFLQNPPLRRNAKYFLVMNHHIMIRNHLKSQKKRVQRRAMETWVPQEYVMWIQLVMKVPVNLKLKEQEA